MNEADTIGRLSTSQEDVTDSPHFNYFLFTGVDRQAYLKAALEGVCEQGVAREEAQTGVELVHDKITRNSRKDGRMMRTALFSPETLSVRGPPYGTIFLGFIQFFFSKNDMLYRLLREEKIRLT